MGGFTVLAAAQLLRGFEPSARRPRPGGTSSGRSRACRSGWAIPKPSAEEFTCIRIARRLLRWIVAEGDGKGSRGGGPGAPAAARFARSTKARETIALRSLWWPPVAPPARSPAAVALSWEANAVNERREARIRTQAIEGRLDIEHGHLPIPRLDRLLEPFEGAICLAETDLHRWRRERVLVLVVSPAAAIRRASQAPRAGVRRERGHRRWGVSTSGRGPMRPWARSSSSTARSGTPLAT